MSFGTQQSLDALIHQIESEIDSQTESGTTNTTDVPQSGGMLMDNTTNEDIMETVNSIENEELYHELESELSNAFESDNNDTAQIEILEEVVEGDEMMQRK